MTNTTKLNKPAGRKALMLLAAGFTMAGLQACDLGTGAATAGKTDSTAEPVPTSPTSGTPQYVGPAEVERYLAKFLDDALIQGVDMVPELSSPGLEIRIASLDSYGSSVIGLCETGTALRRVTFDPDFWNSVSETQRELLAHHEFGHCMLYRPHRTSTLSGGAYASIMYPVIMASSTYTANYDYYQQELFTQASSDANGVDPAMPTVHICDPSELAAHAATE